MLRTLRTRVGCQTENPSKNDLSPKFGCRAHKYKRKYDKSVCLVGEGGRKVAENEAFDETAKEVVVKQRRKETGEELKMVENVNEEEVMETVDNEAH